MCKARRRSAVVCAALGLVTGNLLSAGRQDTSGQQRPTYRSGVQLVEVDVRVFDRTGRFVTDLTPDDFEILEDGRPQRIEAVHLFGAGGDARGEGEPPPQTWVFIFDLQHLTPGNGFDRARRAVEDYIRDHFRDGDLGGIIAGDRLLNERLTSVRTELLDAVRTISPRDDSRARQRDLTREWPRLLDEDEAIRIARDDREAVRRAAQRACLDDPPQCQVAEMAVMEKGRRMATVIHRATFDTLNTVHALASSLARVPGPKTVVLLTDGFVVQDVESTLRSTAGQMARSGARVYAIDVRGLNRRGSVIDQDYTTLEAGPVTKYETLVDGPNSLAVDTGGLFIRNENNIGRALERVTVDAGRYYVLAYQPPSVVWDGRYRRIHVRVKRDGLRVRARTGYLALEPARMLKLEPLSPPAIAASSAGAAGISAPAEPPPAVPAPPAPVTAGSVVSTSSAYVDGTTRLRPDAEARVKALSARDPAASATADLAARGWQAYEKGDIEAARAAFSAAASHADVRPWVLYALGMTQTALNRPSDAVASWEKVRAAVPDFEPVYMDLADTYAHLGDLTQALTTLREAEKRWPASADVQSALGVILVRRGALNDGITALERAASLQPDDALAHLNVARGYALRYTQGRRYVSSLRRWVGSDADRERALAAFRRSVSLGGPYAQQASEELNLLERSK